MSLSCSFSLSIIYFKNKYKHKADCITFIIKTIKITYKNMSSILYISNTLASRVGNITSFFTQNRVTIFDICQPWWPIIIMTDHLTTAPALNHLKGYEKYGLNSIRDYEMSYQNAMQRWLSSQALTINNIHQFVYMTPICQMNLEML